VPQIRKSIDISASPENVFGYVTNPKTVLDWMRFIREMEVTSGDGKSAGTRDRAVFKLGPRAQRQEGEWTEYNPPSSFVRTVNEGTKMESRMTLSPLDDGTRVEWLMLYTPPMGPVGMAVDAFFMNRVFQNEMEESLETLKAQLEG
jgi:uncharacterized protein YndB with AHSA1/START domain